MRWVFLVGCCMYLDMTQRKYKTVRFLVSFAIKTTLEDMGGKLCQVSYSKNIFTKFEMFR